MAIIPLRIRQVLGRTRMALNYATGRQEMAKGVASYDDDVWVVSYPKSGNTWTRFLIANLVAGERAVDWANIEQLVPDIYIGSDPLFRTLPRPRYFKSHEAYRPEYRRVVFIVRDPRDIAISYYHSIRKANRLPVDAPIDTFMKRFLEGSLDPYGSWGENVGSWLGARRGSSDFTVLRYEDMLANTEGQLARIAEALKLPIQNGDLCRAVENSRADRMRALEQQQRNEHKFLKSSRADIPFVRAATSGQWRSELPPDAARQIETTWHDLMRELGYV